MSSMYEQKTRFLCDGHINIQISHVMGRQPIEM